MVKDITVGGITNDNDTIWRYMDFASFCSLLLSESLFFRRLDKYSDEYEGTLPDDTKSFMHGYFSSIWFLPDLANNSVKHTDDFASRMLAYRRGTLSNSWVLHSEEIYAMWKIYLGGSLDGIAIRTTVGKLREVLSSNPAQFVIGKVSYETLAFMQTDPTTLPLCKKKPYSYEYEFRALIFNQFTQES